MTEFAYAVIVIGFLILGARLFMKLREIASWKPEEPPEVKEDHGSRRDLLDLKIEDPKNDFESIQGRDGEQSPER